MLIMVIHGLEVVKMKTEVNALAEIRKELGLGKGRIQLSSHGAGKYSLQLFLKGKLTADINISRENFRLISNL